MDYKREIGRLKGLHTRRLHILKDVQRIAALLDRARADLAHAYGKNLPYTQIAKWLNAQGVRTRGNKKWRAETVSRLYGFKKSIIEIIDSEFSIKMLLTAKAEIVGSIVKLKFDKDETKPIIHERNEHIIELYRLESIFNGWNMQYNFSNLPAECFDDPLSIGRTPPQKAKKKFVDLKNGPVKFKKYSHKQRENALKMAFGVSKFGIIQ